MHGLVRCLPHVAGFACLTLVFGPGCSRYHYRERADKDVAGVISQKNIFPDWQVKKDWHAYPDPRARFADNTNPDRPPYPPDDFAARTLSPNPQRPTKKSGVGRMDGTGYVALLEHWDAENRADDPLPPARGVAQDDPFPAPFFKREGPRTEGPRTEGPRTSAAGAALTPGSGGKLVADHPAVRHRLPLGYPGTFSPASEKGTAQKPVAPNAAAKTTPAKPDEFGPWTASGRGALGPTIVTDRGNQPGSSKLPPPKVIVVSGTDEAKSGTIPAGGTSLQPPVPPPETAPAQPVPLPEPRPVDPKQPDGEPLGKMSDLYPQGLTTGDPESDYLKALESAQIGYRLKLDQAIELGLFNAREYQDRREDLYLSALPVTLERFNFAAQALFIEKVVRQSTGRELATAGERWNLGTTAGISKLFPTGALLTAQLANQVVIDLSGDRPQTSISNLTLSLAQPFLRGGGFAVTLEGLTQAERTLLYAMRSYARFRKIFYVAIAGGGGYTNNPYGLQGLSPNLGRGIGGNLTAPSTGFLPLLYQSALIANQRKNVSALERLLRLYQEFREGGQQSDLQVGQVEVNLLNSRAQLLGQAGGVAAGSSGGSGIRGYLGSLDNYKLQLGLPMTVGLDLDDAPLRPIREQLGRFEEVYAQVNQVELRAAKYDPAAPVAGFRARWRALLTESPLVAGTPFAKSIGERFDSWSPSKLTDDRAAARLASLREERRKRLDARADRLVKGQPEPPAETQRIAQLEDEIDLGEFDRLVRVYESQPWAKLIGPAKAGAQAAAFRDAFNAFYLLILEARNDRLVLVRGRWPELPPLAIGAGGTDALAASLDEAYAASVQTALANRLDLMNARAQVVDAWRQIAVQANSLQGVFDVRYDLTSSTPAGRNNGLAFSADRSDHRLTFNAELPLVRRAERNMYRAALVAYQRQRRTLMAFEDNIANDVRSDLRSLRTLAQLYRIQQRVVELGYSQVDNAQAILLAPPAPGAGNDAGSAAALTQQVLQAQSNLVGAQNSLYQIWVAYQTGRMQFYLDLEQMTLDDRGVWIDEFFNRADRSRRSPGAAGEQPRQPAGERLPAPRPANPGGG
ncbi:MAG TPA: TolC family protein [Gemmata sp.]